MSASRIAELQELYIELSKKFFEEIERGVPVNELQPLQEKIEHTLIQLDQLQQQDKNTN